MTDKSLWTDVTFSIYSLFIKSIELKMPPRVPIDKCGSIEFEIQINKNLQFSFDPIANSEPKIWPKQNKRYVVCT